MHLLYIAVSRPLKKEKKPPRRLMELSVCLEELMDTPTFKRFNTALDAVLEAAEDMDLASIRGVYIDYLLIVWFCWMVRHQRRWKLRCRRCRGGMENGRGVAIPSQLRVWVNSLVGIRAELRPQKHSDDIFSCENASDSSSFHHFCVGKKC